ncbi:MAG: alpha/beta hydrolase [Aquabacterium sp.]|nr:alpha/beta hydrolase [Aquabacterium sp.]
MFTQPEAALTPVRIDDADGVGPTSRSDQAPPSTLRRFEVHIGGQGLPGELALVPQARGLVVFAHGSGSSRLSPRNRLVADILHGYRLDTLLFDLLTDSEAADRRKVFDIDLLGQRVGAALQWTRTDERCARLGTGLFGASTGAAAALSAAALHPGWVTSVVSRGGRPDLAAALLPKVQSPTLLIVGGHDTEVLQLNRGAMRLMQCESRLEVVPGATHLFEELGAIETVAHLAGSWFANHLPLRVQ